MSGALALATMKMSGLSEREITVMISDLENFSNLVASLDLETFTGVIN